MPDAPPVLLDEASAWAVLHQVLDPEVPVLSVCELGIVRAVAVQGGEVRVTVTPTYSGCPATEAIADAIRSALLAAGAATVHVDTVFTPAWTSDWIGGAAREKLRAYGIAPPHLSSHDAAQPLRFHPRGVACPRCSSTRSEQLSAFGGTACKALYRCTECREPFEYFKPI